MLRERGGGVKVKVHFLLVSSGDDRVIVDRQSNVQEDGRGGRYDRFNAPFQHSKVVDIFFKYYPVFCQDSSPDTEDTINDLFLVK